jgi:hypothetical protein
VADPAPIARVVARRPLRYRRGADPALDRPGFVRAASALVWSGDDLIVIQDDALFVGIVEPATGLVDDIPVAGVTVRTFDAARGNKQEKPDLESAIVLGDELIAFGSGGPLEHRQVVLRRRGGDPPVLQPAPGLFAALAAVAVPEGALNVEGAVVLGNRVWFANRGGDRGLTQDCLLAVSRDGLRAALAGTPVDVIARVELALPALDGVGLHITDLATDGARLWCVATAERTTSFFHDGSVVGSAIGLIDLATASVELARVDTRDKLEGLAFDRARPGTAWAVTDPDDPEAPAELLELEITRP